MGLGHPCADFDEQIELLFHVLLGYLQPRVRHNLQRRRVLLAIYREPNLIFAGKSLRTIRTAGPQRRPRHPGCAFIAHVPDKAVQPGFGWEPTVWRARSKAFIVASLAARLRLGRILADDLAFLVENLQSNGSTLCAFSAFAGCLFGFWRHRCVGRMGLPRLLAFRWRLFGLSCRGLGGAALSLLFFRLLLSRFLQSCFQRVIDHCSVRWIL